MPDYARLHEQSLAAVPQFDADARETFAFLELTYGYHFHGSRLDSADDVRDANARVLYLGPAVEVEIYWYFSTAGLGVAFAQTPAPWTSLQRRVFFGDLKDAMPAARLYTLAEMRGHADDAAFLLGDTDQVDGRSINTRVKVVQANLRGVLDGLAVATERYAADILRGDTAPLAEAMRSYTRMLGR